MLHMLYFYVAKAILVCCMDRPMGDVCIGRPDASSADFNSNSATKQSVKVREPFICWGLRAVPARAAWW